MCRQLSRRSVFALTWIVLVSCGGEAEIRPAVDEGPISGVINTGSFVIPAGQTRTAVADLEIISSGPIEIQGTLKVKEGARVKLRATGDTTVGGSVAPVEGVEGVASRGAAQEDIVISGQNVSIDGKVESQSGYRIDVVAKEAITVGLGGSVITRAGRKGKSRGIDGEDSGSISLSGKKVAIRGILRTGDAGDGGDDTAGVDVGDYLEAKAGSGGDAGSININVTVDETIHGTAQLITGDGGDGGRIMVRARDGQTDGQKGQGVHLICGSGGYGGSMGVFGNATGIFGVGGTPSEVEAVVGNGAYNADGGQGTVRLGQAGTGKGGQAPPKGIWSRILLSGGNGGVSKLPGVPGGAAGALDVFHEDSVPALESGYREVEVTNGFSGGAGFDGCAANPQAAGTDGGSVPKMGPLMPHILLTRIGRCFSGGNGGDGLLSAGGPGSGAPAGLNAENQPIGVEGVDGESCGGGTALQIINPPDADTFCDLRGFNDHGECLIVSSPDGSSLAWRTYVYRNQFLEQIVSPPAFVRLSPSMMNTAGVIVGRTFPSSGQPFAWTCDRESVFTRLFPDDTSHNACVAINNNGDRLAVKGIASGSVGRPSLLTASGETPIGPFNNIYPTVFAVNNSRAVVGGLDGDAFRWNAGNVQKLLPLNGAYTAVGLAINDNGVTVGGSTLLSLQTKATIWSPNDAMELPTIDQPSGFALGVNNQSIVVGYQRTSSSVPSEALYWINGTPHKVSEHSTNPSLQFLRAENVNGTNMIAGEGFNTSTNRRFVFTLQLAP